MKSHPIDSLLYARISADYPDRPGVLREVELEIAPGEIVGLVGESGSGKSVMAMSLMQLLPYPGRVTRGTARLARQAVVAQD